MKYKDVLEWLDNLPFEKKINKEKYADVHVVDDKIAVCFDPMSSSSAELREHQAEYKEKGLSLYLLFHWDSNKIFSMIESKLGMDTVKYAAKRMIIEEIDNKLGNEFCKMYHYQGVAGGAGKISLCLRDKKTREVIGVQQYSKNRWGGGKISETSVFEGLRLCFKTGVHVYGGASRFQKYFEQNYNPEKIISYIDLNHSDGKYKAHQGFKLVGDSPALSYRWILRKEPVDVMIIDKNGMERHPDLDIVRNTPLVNPNRIAGAFGKGVGQTFYGGKLGSRKQLKEAGNELIHNDMILEALGYEMMFTAGQALWVKEFDKNEGKND